jgi:hypothetical protein
MTALCIFLGILLLLAAWHIAVLTLKIGYYEQTLKLNQHKFTLVRWRQIEAIMRKKKPY